MEPIDNKGLTDDSGSSSPPGTMPRSVLVGLILGALGVVYGDIGTSPLYAFRECFNPRFGLALTPSNVMGILSLIFWSLTLVVSVKYVSFVTHADNRGEGGIFALMARIMSVPPDRQRLLGRRLMVILGLCGTALLVADGMITPAISVLSAVEGLKVAAPGTDRWVMPITIGILIGLFLVQKRGTTTIGTLFGPVMLAWFVTIAWTGMNCIVHEPYVLLAVSPHYAVNFFAEHHWHGILILGAVVLCVTGCEALFADLGHFGRKPIAMAWHSFVFPCVLLNYFGQGAFVLTSGDASGHIFFNMAPAWSLYPLVAIATVATIIASQALISGMFSLARQCVQLDYLPRMNIVHTSQTMHGQIYIPEINAILAVACVMLVLGFRTSSDLSAAYGIAVIGTMAITSILMFAVQYEQHRWSIFRALLVAGFFLVIDTSFLVGNLGKFWEGGWFPIVIGIGVLAVLTTWKRGTDAVRTFTFDGAIPLTDFMKQLHSESIPRVKGSAMFIMSSPEHTPRVLLHHLKHNKVLHEQVILMSVVTENVPTVSVPQQLAVEDIGSGFLRISAHCGFMQTLDMREILRLIQRAGVKLKGEVSYFIGHMTLKASGRAKLPIWRKLLFAFLFHNERSPTTFLGIPPNRVVELGEQAEL